MSKNESKVSVIKLMVENGEQMCGHSTILNTTVSKGTLAYVNESLKKSEYECLRTAYVRLYCLNVKPEL